MSEKFINNEQYPKQTSYDEHLYGPFAEVASFQAYEYLNGDTEYRKEQKRQFIAGEVQNPTLDYPEINLDNLYGTEIDLLAIKKGILLNEQNEVVKQAYRWRLNEKLAEVRMLKAVASSDMRRFNRYSEYIYGKPSADIFAYTLNSERENAEKLKDSDDQNISQSANRLLELLPEMQAPRITELPDSETINYARDQTISEFGGLINMPSDVPKFDANQIQDVFETALGKLETTDWKIIVNEKTSSTAVSVNQEHKEVNIPQSRTVGKVKLTGLIIHELGTHVARRENGERSTLKLLGLGLDRYESGEEGIATMREQTLSKKIDDFRGIDGHLAIGLARGVDGQPRNFRQVYEILEQNYLLKNLVKGTEPSEALEKARNSAWNHSVRTFRGTDCKTPGVCLTKDIVYREGNIGIWDVIKNNPSEMMRFNVGKYDPSNSRHLWVLEQLGISDQDLSKLDE
jgi:uncharacterized protein YwgA